MATLVSFHAHPDDETTSTGGTIARAAAEGHRVVLVFGTNGEEGEPVPGVLDEQSTLEESHSDSLLEYPHYTRPAVWEGREVPGVLLSGHHGQVAAWRHRERLRRTLERRPDMLAHADLKQADKDFLQSLGWQPPA